MKPPIRVYLISFSVGTVGMLAGGAAHLIMNVIWGAHHGVEGVIFFFPWLFATIVGINLGFKEGRKATGLNPRE